MKNIRFTICSTLFLIISFSITCYSQNASQVVDTFYKFHRSQPTTFNSNEIEARKKWFSDEFYKLFLKELEREEEFLKKHPTDKPYFGDGLPFQPYDECYIEEIHHPNTYKIGKAKKFKGKMIVEIKFYTPKECGSKYLTSYVIELVRSGKIWLINDWIYAKDDRLSDTLKRTD